jgi:hypothetical protein
MSTCIQLIKTIQCAPNETDSERATNGQAGVSSRRRGTSRQVFQRVVTRSLDDLPTGFNPDGIGDLCAVKLVPRGG